MYTIYIWWQKSISLYKNVNIIVFFLNKQWVWKRERFVYTINAYKDIVIPTKISWFVITIQHTILYLYHLYMKKIMKWLYIVMLLSFGFVLYTKVSAQSYTLGMIEVNFCNDNQSRSELDLISKAGTPLPICVQFVNTSTSPITINAEFLDSLITSDELKDRACNAADRPKTQFGNFLLPYSWEIVLPPQQTVQKEYTIQYPIGFSWLSHGCLAYHIVWEDVSNEYMFTIRLRSIKYLDVLVSDTKAVQVLDISQWARIKRMGDEYIITLWIKNKGNVDEKVHITSILSNMFWYQKDFSFDVIIPASSWIVLTTPSFILPVYGWLFQLKSTIDYTPKFNFNITDGKQPSQIYAWWTKTIQNILIVWTRESWIILIIIILCATGIVRLIYRKKWHTTKK